MDNNIGIVVQIKFDDEQKNLQNLTNALAKLQDKVNKNSLNIGFNFNNKDLDSGIKNIEQQIEKIQKQINVLNDTKLQILNPKEIDVQIKGTLKSLEQVQSALKSIGMYNQGEVKIKVVDIDKETNAINKFITTVKDAQGILKTFESTRGFLPGTGDNLNLEGYNLSLKSIVDTTNTVTTKLNEFKTKYNEIVEGLRSFNLLDSNEINKVSEAINNLTTDAKKVDFDNIKNQVKSLETSLSEAQKIKGLGTNLGTGTGLNLSSSINEIEKYIQTLHEGETSVKFLSGVLEENNNKMRQVNYTVNDGNGMLGKYTLTINGTNNSVYNLKKGFTAVNEKSISFVNNIREMITNVTGVSLGLMAVYKSIDLLKSGFSDAIELQSALAQINVTMNTSQQQLQQLSNAVVEQSKQWGLNATEVENAMKVYANMNETVSSIVTKTNSDLILAKLSGLPTTTTTDSIQSAISQFGLQAKDSEKVVDILTSVSSNMSMDFSKGINEIINGLKVSGSTAKEAGLSLSEYASILGSVIEKTRLGGSTIGQGEKSIFSRLERVRNGAAVDDEGQDLSKTETILRSQGIEIRKDADSFKPMAEILQTIAEKFKTASDTEKAYIADAAAGINQRNVFINMIDAYSKAMDMNSKAVNSNGFAQQQINKIMDTTATKIEQLKATVQGMFLQAVDSKGMGVMVDDLKTLAEGFNNVVQHVGLMNTAIITLSTGMLTFNKSMQMFQITDEGVVGLSKNANSMFTSLKNGLDSTSSSWRKNYTELSLNTQEYGKFTDLGNKAKASALTLGDGMNALANSTKMATIANTAFNAVIGVGIGLLISLAVEGIMKVVNAEKDLAQSNKEIADSVSNNIQNNNSNIQTLQGIQKEYEELKSKTSLTADEQKRYNDICGQIAGINKDATITYDSQGKAILNMKGNVDDLIKSLKEKNQLENLKLEDNLGNQYKEYNNTVNKDKPDISQNPYAYAKYAMPEGDNEQQLNNLKKSLADYGNEREKLIKSNSSTDPVDKDIDNVNQQIDTLTNKIKEAKIEQDDAFNKLKTNILAILQDGSKYNDVFDGMDDSTKKLVTDSEFLKTIFKPNGDIDTETAQYKKFLETIANSSAYKTAQDGLSSLTDTQKETVNKLMSGFNINEFAKNGKMDEYYNIMSKIEDMAKKGAPSLEQFKNILTKAFPDLSGKFSSEEWTNLFNSISNGANNATSAINDTSKSVEQLQQDLDSNLTKANNYSKMLNEIKDKGVINESSQKEILTNKDYQDLLPFLNDMNGLSSELSKRINDIQNKSVGLFAAMNVQNESKAIQDLIDKYQQLSSEENLSEEDKKTLASVVDQLKGKVDGLVVSKDSDGKTTIKGIELTNDRIKSLDNEQKYLQLVAQVGQEKAKDQMASEMLKTQITYAEVKKRLEAYDKEAMASNSDGRQNAKQQALSIALMEIDDAMKVGNADLVKAQKQAGDIINNLSEDTSNNTAATKALTAANKANTEAVKEASNETKDYDNQLKNLANDTKLLDYSLSKLDEHSNDYINGLETKKDLLQQQIDLTNEAIQANQDSATSLYNLAGAYDKVNDSSSTSSSSSSSGAWKGKYSNWINGAASQFGLDPYLVASIIQTESSFNPNIPDSSAGAEGLAQFLPSTAAEVGINPKDPQQAIYGLAKYLKQRINQAGSLKGGIKGYGEGTEQYYNTVMGYYNQFKAGSMGDGGASTGDETGQSNISSVVSGAETAESKVESLKSSLIDLQTQFDKLNVDIFNAKLGQFDDKITNTEKKIDIEKQRYKLFEEGTNADQTPIQVSDENIWKEINNKYNALYQKEQFITTEMQKNTYDEKTLASMRQTLLDVQEQEYSTINDLHSQFDLWLQNKYTIATQGMKDNIEDYQKQIELLQTVDSKGNYAGQLTYSQKILDQQVQTREKTILQLQKIRDLYNQEQNGNSRVFWLNQYEKYNKILEQTNIDIVKTQQSINNLKIDDIFNKLSLALKPVNDELEELNIAEKNIADNNFSSKLQNDIDTINDLTTQINLTTQAYEKMYEVFSSDGLITNDEQEQLDAKKKDIKDLQQQRQNLLQETNNVNLNNLVSPYERNISNSNNNSAMLQYELDMTNSTDYSTKMNLVSKEIDDNSSKLNSYIDEYNVLSQESFPKGSKEAENLANTLAQLRDKMIEASKQSLELKKNFDQLALSQMFKPIDLMQSNISQQQSNIDYTTSMGNKGLLLGTNFQDTTQQYSEQDNQEKIADTISDINSKIDDLSPDIDTSISDNINSLNDTVTSNTNSTNDILSSIDENTKNLKNTNDSSEISNVFGTADDLKNAKMLAEQYGISGKFNFVDTNSSEYLQNKDKYVMDSSSYVLGGTGAIGAISSNDINGATRLWGQDSTKTMNAIKDEFSKIADQLSSNSSENSSSQTNTDILKALDTNNTSSQSIVENTKSTVDATNVQTTTFGTDISTNITNLNNNLITSDNNIIAENEKIYNENVTTNNNLTNIYDGINKLSEELTSIITKLDTIDTDNKAEFNQILQELINLHTSINILGKTVADGLSTGDNSVSFNGTAPVSIQNNTDKNKQATKNANGNTKLDPSVLGDGTGKNKGEELVIHKDGSTELIGKDGWTLVPNLSEDDVVLSHEDTKKVLSQGGIKKVSKHATGTYDPNNKDFLSQINTQSTTQVSVNKEIARIQEQYTSDLANGASNSELIQNNIELSAQNILLANDAINQFKSKEEYFGSKEHFDQDSLNQLAQYEQKENQIIQQEQQKIQSLSKQKVDALFVNSNTQLKNIENNNKEIGSTSTPDELENDKRKIELLKNQNKELEVYKDNLKTITGEEDKTTQQLSDFKSSSLSVADNKTLTDLLLKQANGETLTDEQNATLTKLESTVSKLDPDGSVKLQTIINYLSAIKDKKTETTINIQSTKDSIESEEYSYAQQIIQNQKSLDEAKFNQMKKDKAKEYFNVTEDEFNQYKASVISQDQKDIANSQAEMQGLSLEQQQNYLDEIKAKENDIANTQKQNYSDIYNWEDTFIKVHQQRISQLEEENKLQEEKEAKLKREVDLIQLEQELNGAANEKNVQQLTKDKNGNWQFGYVADQVKVDDLQKQVRDKMEENADADRQQEIQDEKDAEQTLINQQKNAYDQMINDQQEILNEKYSDMNYLTEQYLQKIKDQVGNDDNKIRDMLEKELTNSQTALKTFTDNIDGQVSDMVSYIEGLVKDTINNSKTDATNNNKDIGSTVTTPSINGGTVTNDQAKLEAYKNSDAFKAIKQIAANMAVGLDTTTTVEQLHQQEADLAKQYGVSLDTGGYTGDWGTSEGKTAILHEKELVLNKEDTKNTLSAIKESSSLLDKLKNMELSSLNLPNIASNLFSNISLPNMNMMPNLNIPDIDRIMTNNSTQPIVHNNFDNIHVNCPNIIDGESFISALKDLPNLAMQRAHNIYDR